MWERVCFRVQLLTENDLLFGCVSCHVAVVGTIPGHWVGDVVVFFPAIAIWYFLSSCSVHLLSFLSGACVFHISVVFSCGRVTRAMSEFFASTEPAQSSFQ